MPPDIKSPLYNLIMLLFFFCVWFLFAMLWLKGNLVLVWLKGNQFLYNRNGISSCMTKREPVIVWLKGNQLLCDWKGTSYCVTEREPVIVWLKGNPLLCDWKGTSDCVTERAYTTHCHSYRNSVCKLTPAGFVNVVILKEENWEC